MCYCKPEVRTPICSGCAPVLFKEVQFLQSKFERMEEARNFYEHKAACLEMERASQERIITAQRKALDDIASTAKRVY